MEEQAEAHVLETGDGVAKLGVDVGGVIIAIGGATGKEDTFFGENFVQSAAVEGAFEGLKKIAAHIGSDNVYVVSKCSPSTEKKTLEWMAYNKFHDITGIKVENIHFCKERHEKAPICERLGITMFIDDREDVLAFVSKCPKMETLFLFTGGAPGRSERHHHHGGRHNKDHHHHHHHNKRRDGRHTPQEGETHHHHSHHSDQREHRHHHHHHEGDEKDRRERKHHHHHHEGDDKDRHEKKHHHHHHQHHHEGEEKERHEGKHHHHHHRKHRHPKEGGTGEVEGEITLPIIKAATWPELAEAVIAESNLTSNY